VLWVPAPPPPVHPRVRTVTGASDRAAVRQARRDTRGYRKLRHSFGTISHVFCSSTPSPTPHTLARDGHQTEDSKNNQPNRLSQLSVVLAAYKVLAAYRGTYHTPYGGKVGPWPTPATRSEPTPQQQTKIFSVRSTQYADQDHMRVSRLRGSLGTFFFRNRAPRPRYAQSASPATTVAATLYKGTKKGTNTSRCNTNLRQRPPLPKTKKGLTPPLPGLPWHPLLCQ